MLLLSLLEMSMTSHSCFKGALCTVVHRGVVHPFEGKQRLLLVGVVPLYVREVIWPETNALCRCGSLRAANLSSLNSVVAKGWVLSRRHTHGI